MASRVICKGAISFGLVHVPVALYPASTEGGIDFDWLDKRSMDPVGYKRINKRTGKARGDAASRRDRHRARRAAHQGTPRGADPHRPGADHEHAALEQRDWSRAQRAMWST